MEKEQHIQWAIYCMDNNDYYVSLNMETLEKIKQWNIIKSKIVYLTDKDIEKMAQKQLFLTLLTNEERKNNRWESKIIHAQDKIWIKISDYLLNRLIDSNPKDFEHRYGTHNNKMHFLIKDVDWPFNDKSWFDRTFQSCERQNKKLPTEWDLFESDYINVYKPK